MSSSTLNHVSCAIALSLFASIAAAGEPCEDNFSVSGNLLTGKTYRTTASIANSQPRDAFDGAMAFISGNGFTVQSSDKNAGTISAVQTSNKRVPLAILLSPDGVNTKLAFTYQTPTGVHSPEDAIRKHFCNTIVAATNTAGAAAAVPPPVNVAPIAAKSEPPTVQPVTAQPTAQFASKSNAPAPIPNSEFVKNGMPCLAEICIGDGVSELKKINWKPVKPLDKSYLKYQRDSLVKNYRGNIEEAGIHLLSPAMGVATFDNATLTQLEKITAFCRFDAGISLYGYFDTKSGHPTTVRITMTPNENNSEHRWTVIHFSRRYPHAISYEQKNDLSKQLAQRYEAFHYTKQMLSSKTGSASANWSGDYLMIDQEWGDITNRSQKHPACGGSKKISLD